MKFILFLFVSKILVLSCSRESSEPFVECFFPELEGNLYALGIEENFDNTLLISLKLQYFISKIDYSSGEIKWIMGDHENWKKPWKEYLLTPLNFDSTIHPDNDWPYSQLMPRITKNGTILVYDNGGGRPGGNLTRAVEYRVDPENMTVEKIWSYELDIFTSALGSIYRYEDITIQIGHGNPGKLYEISYEGEIILESFLYSYYRAYPITLY